MADNPGDASGYAVSKASRIQATETLRRAALRRKVEREIREAQDLKRRKPCP